jgi:hypothetical protein
MTYQINKTDGSLLAIINDGIVDENTTSLKLVGRNLVNYGVVQNENFVSLLENFANTSQPSGPLAGQLWFNSSTDDQHLYFYNSNSVWHRMPSIVSTSTSPTTQQLGDLWHNLNSDTLYLRTAGNSYALIGPVDNVDIATKLRTARKINNKTFDGTEDIVISSTTTNALTPGSYIDGQSFNGSNALTWNVDTGVVTTPTANKVVARDTNGDIYFNVGHGTATSARFADLAEKYLIEGEYEVGTVVSVGGSKELRPCQLEDRAIGVVSANPAYLMNSTLEDGTSVALKGRVPTKISGVVKKGDRLIAGSNGVAISATFYGYGNVFGIALEDSNGRDLIEAIIL